MQNKKVVQDLVKYFKLPALLFAIGFVLQLIFKFSFHFNMYVGLTFGFLSILLLGTGCMGIIYMTMLIFSDGMKKESSS